MIISFPIAFLVGTLVTDLAYLGTTDLFWATASYWLLAGALIMAAVAAVLGFIDFFGDERIRKASTAWYHMIGNLVAVLLSLANFVLRMGGPANGYPAGMWISLVVVLLLLFNGWMGWELVYKHRVGVSEQTGRT
jgi:uncharacterized membrane protein